MVEEGDPYVNVLKKYRCHEKEKIHGIKNNDLVDTRIIYIN